MSNFSDQSLTVYSVLASPTALPGFWIFMYRVSPFTYLVSGMLSTGLANNNVVCSSTELLHFEPANSQTCADYMQDYIDTFGGYLTEASQQSTTTCEFCSADDVNVVLDVYSVRYGDRWRNLGIFWVYIIFNVVMAIVFYYWARVPKAQHEEQLQREELKREETKREELRKTNTLPEPLPTEVTSDEKTEMESKPEVPRVDTTQDKKVTPATVNEVEVEPKSDAKLG